jgi:hypothetical protein
MDLDQAAANQQTASYVSPEDDEDDAEAEQAEAGAAKE